MATKPLCSIQDCGKPVLARDWCDMHYRRWRAHGDPLGRRTFEGEATRYFREVVLAYEGDECLIWPYYCDPHGYGRLKSKIVSRLVCEEVNGPPPTPGHEAAHSCGKGDMACVARGHLSWKTHAENMHDMTQHGTQMRGARHTSAKLTEASVKTIRDLRGVRTQHQIAKQFAVSQSLVSYIQMGRYWRS